MDGNLRSRIELLMKEGVKTTSEMKRHLAIYVKEVLFPGQKTPSKNNRRFFPKDKDITNAMHLVTVKERFSTLDQENVQKYVGQKHKM